MKRKDLSALNLYSTYCTVENVCSYIHSISIFPLNTFNITLHTNIVTLKFPKLCLLSMPLLAYSNSINHIVCTIYAEKICSIVSYLSHRINNL